MAVYPPEPEYTYKMEKGKVVEVIDADLEPLIPKFMNTTRRELKEMREALEKKDYETVRRLGHNTKGAGLGYGFMGMGEIGQNIEKAAGSMDSSACGQLIETLSEYLDDLEITYQEM